jgi:transcriptional regulator with XRE-family HTH domain
MTDYISFLKSFSSRLSSLGKRSKQLRLLRNFTQQELARRAGVGTSTLHRFEKKGHISLENALRIAMALGVDDTFEKLFELPPYKTLDEALERPKKLEHKRARRSI